MAKLKEQHINFPLTPFQEQAVKSPAPIVFLIGPEGEGKTYSLFVALNYHAANSMNGQLLRAAIIRDTFENISTKTIPSIQKAIGFLAEKNKFPGYIQSWVWSRGGKRLICKAPRIEVDLFGADDLASIARLQGGEWSFIGIEEPAPMYQGNSAGIPRGVFDTCVSRAARGGGAMKLFVDQNPGDEDHWTHEAAITAPIMRPEHAPMIWTETVNIPPGSNPARTEQMRQATVAAYAGNSALTLRYVKGQWAFVQMGEKVTPEYHDNIDGHPHHYTGKPLAVIPNAMGFRSWDGGHFPTCVIGQVTPSGRLHIIDCFRGEHIGMKQLIDTMVRPAINLRYSGVTDWLDTGDPTLETGDNSDIEQSPARVIEKEFKTSFQGASHWPAVLEPMKSALNLTIDGRPYVQIGSGAEIVHKALRGGWHYLTTNADQVIRDKPVKDIHCVDVFTEILTVDGFKSYSEIKVGQKCYGWTGGILVDDEISAINVFETPTELMHMTGQSVDMAVTGNHRCLAVRRTCVVGKPAKFSDPHAVEAAKVNSSHHLVISAPWRGRRPKDKEFSDDFIKLAAWVMTEGHYRGTGQVWIYQKNYEAAVAELCGKFAGTVLRKERGGVNACMKHETAYLLRLLMPNKAPSPEFVRMMTAGQMRIFLYESMRGDGTTRKLWPTLEKNPGRNRDMGMGDEAWRIALADQEQQDSVQHMAALLGLRTTVSFKPNFRLVTIWARSGPVKFGSLSVVKTATDRVWCPTTGTGYWVARRNGKVFITGNSHPGDCFGALCLKLLGKPTEKPKSKSTLPPLPSGRAGVFAR